MDPVILEISTLNHIKSRRFVRGVQGKLHPIVLFDEKSISFVI